VSDVFAKVKLRDGEKVWRKLLFPQSVPDLKYIFKTKERDKGTLKLQN